MAKRESNSEVRRSPRCASARGSRVATTKAPTVVVRDGLSAPALERYAPSLTRKGWELALAGYWRQTIYHSGYIEYYVRRHSARVWTLKSIERNRDLDGVTDEEVERGALNDDQRQAMWGMTLEEGQRQEWQEIVAAWTNAPAGTSPLEAARVLYDAVRASSGKVIDEAEDEGLLAKPRTPPQRPAKRTHKGRQ
jgi:hypothetical protein